MPQDFFSFLTRGVKLYKLADFVKFDIFCLFRNAVKKKRGRKHGKA